MFSMLAEQMNQGCCWNQISLSSFKYGLVFLLDCVCNPQRSHDFFVSPVNKPSWSPINLSYVHCWTLSDEYLKDRFLSQGHGVNSYVPSHFVFFIYLQFHKSGFCRDGRWDALEWTPECLQMSPSLSCNAAGASEAPREQWSQKITKNLKHFPLKSGSKLDRNQIRDRNIYCTTKCDFRCTEPHKKINQTALEFYLLVLLCFIIPKSITRADRVPYETDLKGKDFWLFPKFASVFNRRKAAPANDIQKNVL